MKILQGDKDAVAGLYSIANSYINLRKRVIEDCSKMMNDAGTPHKSATHQIQALQRINSFGNNLPGMITDHYDKKLLFLRDKIDRAYHKSIDVYHGGSR